MISKKILFVSVCFAVLFVAVVAYSYVEISKLKNQVNSMSSQRTFNFFWQGPIAEKFNVTTFWMNITFERANEIYLFITVKTNHLIFGNYHVGIVFDTNHNGEIDGNDEGQLYSSANTSVYARLDGPYINGQRFIYSIDGLSSIRFESYFDSQLGYTYVIPIDLQELNLTNDLIHVEYQFAFAVEFCFGKELIT